MTRTDILALALRCAALYVAVNALFLLTNVGYVALAIGLEGGPNLLVGDLGAAVLLAIASWLLFRYAPEIGRRAGGGDERLRLQDTAAIGSIALRLAGIVLWDAALRQLPQVSLMAAISPWAHFAAQLGVVLVFAAFGTWLFVRAEALGQRWFGSSPRASTPSAAVLPSIAFAAVGLWVVLGALPSFVLSVVDIARNSDPYEAGLSASWRELISSGLRLVLGGLLFVGGGAAARTWERLSTAGLEGRSDSA